MSSHVAATTHVVKPIINTMQADEQDVQGNDEVEESWQELLADLAEDMLCGECNEGDAVIQDDCGERPLVQKGLSEPKPPSPEAQRRHNLAHWPCANWCPHCIMASRNNAPHPHSLATARLAPSRFWFWVTVSFAIFRIKTLSHF